MDAKGSHDDKQVNLTMTVSHEDSYLLTAISAAPVFAEGYLREARRAVLDHGAKRAGRNDWQHHHLVTHPTDQFSKGVPIAGTPFCLLRTVMPTTRFCLANQHLHCPVLMRSNTGNDQGTYCSPTGSMVRVSVSPSANQPS